MFRMALAYKLAIRPALTGAAVSCKVAMPDIFNKTDPVWAPLARLPLRKPARITLVLEPKLASLPVSGRLASTAVALAATN